MRETRSRFFDSTSTVAAAEGESTLCMRDRPDGRATCVEAVAGLDEATLGDRLNRLVCPPANSLSLFPRRWPRAGLDASCLVAAAAETPPPPLRRAFL